MISWLLENFPPHAVLAGLATYLVVRLHHRDRRIAITLDAVALGVLATVFLFRYLDGVRTSVDDLVTHLMSLLDKPSEIAIGIGAAAYGGRHILRMYFRGEVLQEQRAAIGEMVEEAIKKNLGPTLRGAQQPTAQIHQLPSS